MGLTRCYKTKVFLHLSHKTKSRGESVLEHCCSSTKKGQPAVSKNHLQSSWPNSDFILRHRMNYNVIHTADRTLLRYCSTVKPFLCILSIADCSCSTLFRYFLSSECKLHDKPRISVQLQLHNTKYRTV